MKKATIYSIWALFIYAANAAYTQSPHWTCAKINDKNSTFIEITAPVNELVIAGELKIVLVSDTIPGIRLIGDLSAGRIVKLKQNLKKSRLKISTNPLVLTNEKPLVLISLPYLKSITIKDDATVRTLGALRTDNLKIIMDADGKVEIEVAGGSIKTRVRGLGTIRITGPVQQVSSQTTIDGWQISAFKPVVPRESMNKTAGTENN